MGVCVIDTHSGICRGCARTSAEITDWATTAAEQQSAVWDELPERIVRLGLPKHLKRWSQAGVQAWMADTMRDRAGAWLIGQGAAGAAFAVDPADVVDVADHGDHIVASQAGTRLRFSLNEKTRAFVYGSPDNPDLIALVMPKGRVSFDCPDTPTAIGRDVGAIDREAQTIDAFDLGCGAPHARLMLRVTDDAVHQSMVVACDKGLSDSARSFCLAMTSPASVAIVETEGVRLERTRPAQIGETAAAAAMSARLSRLDLPGWAAVVAAFQPHPKA
ncbi:MAG: DUF1289 domain-containing protein [Pseudomonadota bacterium]